MAAFVGDKSTIFSDVVPGTGVFPPLYLSQFQQQFGFLEDQTEANVVVTMTIASMLVQRQIISVMGQDPDLIGQSLLNYGNGDYWIILYHHAVFCKTAADLIGRRLATDATKQAADRQQAMTDKKDQLLIQYREAIDELIGSSGITVALI
jgi:hypothetical protein